MGDPPPRKRLRRSEGEHQPSRRHDFYIANIEHLNPARNVIHRTQTYLLERVATGVQYVRIETHPTRTIQLSERVPVTSDVEVRAYVHNLYQTVRTLRATEKVKRKLATLSGHDVQGRVASMTIIVEREDVSPAVAVPLASTSHASPSPPTATSNSGDSPPPIASTSRNFPSPGMSTDTSRVATHPIASTSRALPGVITSADDGERTFNVDIVDDREHTTGFLDEVRRYITNRLRTTANALEVWINTSPNASTGLSTVTILDSVERVDSYIKEVQNELETIRLLETLQREANALIVNTMSVHIRRHAPAEQERPASTTYTIPDLCDEPTIKRVWTTIQEHLLSRIQANHAQDVRIESDDEQLAAMSTTVETEEQSRELVHRMLTRTLELGDIEATEQDLIALGEMSPRAASREGRIAGVTITITDRVDSPPMLTWVEVEKAFKRRITTGIIRDVAGVTYTDPRLFLEAAYPLFEQHVRHALQTNALKVNTSLRTLHLQPHAPETAFQY